MIQSKALETNIATYHVDVLIEDRYLALQEVMSKYYGILEGLNIFLKELSHPYKNWRFIISEARGYSLNYFHLMKNHAKGPQAAQIMTDIFLDAIISVKDSQVIMDAADNLLVFIKKILKEADSEIERFIPVINHSFKKIFQCKDDIFFLFVKSFYPINRLAKLFYEGISQPAAKYRDANALMIRYLEFTYSYWLEEKDPLAWLLSEIETPVKPNIIEPLFENISHSFLQTSQDLLADIKQKNDLDARRTLQKLLVLPGFRFIIESYRKLPQDFSNLAFSSEHRNQWKVLFLFHMMNISGLAIMHEDVLRDINRTLSWLIKHESNHQISILIEKTFSILKKNAAKFPGTTLDCVLNMGKGVYQTDESDLVNYFLDFVIDLDFQFPMLQGVSNDWQVQVNPSHLHNIKTWLELIKLNPKWSIRLLSNLIINMDIGGVFIKDTDLFPRDITSFLNSNISSVYNLAKQMARLFPVYFNDIGAEGKLRDISTRVDEISNRKDILIHFLRKQSHVQSSNRILGLMEATFNFWATGSKKELALFVPSDIYNRIEQQGPYIDGIHEMMAALVKQGIKIPEDLLNFKEEKLEELLKAISRGTSSDLERILLLIKFYKHLNHKYNLGFTEIYDYLNRLQTDGFPHLDRLKTALSEHDNKTRLFLLLDYLDTLKKLILSSNSYQAREDIYKKRHFAVDIPSMYGSYHEIKFDALGLTFRLESLINVLLEEMVDDIDLSFITKATFYEIYDRLILFQKALEIDGIASGEMEIQMDLLSHSLDIKEFTFTQYLDIFKGFAKAVKNIINDYFNNIHGQNLTNILLKMPQQAILNKYLPRGEKISADKLDYRISEIFFRNQIALSLGLQQLDLFLSRILNTLFHQAGELPDDTLQLLLNYDPMRNMTSLSNANNMVTGIIYLGNKGFNMVRLHNFGLPVPPAFIITTEAFRCREIIEGFSPASANFREQLARQIAFLEKITGKYFGNPQNPLLFSVRSGSSISQPGMMDTFLNVGINQEITKGIADLTGNAWFAWDCYRRFLQCYGMAMGLERDAFDAVISSAKEKLGFSLKKHFSGEQMKKVALTYKEFIHDNGFPILENSLDQLHMTIKNVFASWNSAKARTYRKIMGISDDWGTAVTVQEMVFGNLSDSSGSGVFFTHNPRWSGDSLSLWGDFTLQNQGEDVVSGLVRTMPISIKQQDIEMRNTDYTLETHFHEIYQELKSWAVTLIEEKGWSPQEMEFTFEGSNIKDLYLLQTRDMSMREHKKVLTFDLGAKEHQDFLGNGIGVSGGAMSGRIVFTLAEIQKYREQEPETSLILVRSDTVPDDIKEIYATNGLLTAKGGVTSHASVVAHHLNKTCVVGCGALICNEKEKFAGFGQVILHTGDHISIDGREGSVYQGPVKINQL